MAGVIRGILFYCVLLLATLNTPVQAQTTTAAGPISLTVQPGLGGYAKLNRWVPIALDLRNDGAVADVEAVTAFTAYGQGPPLQYRLALQLPGPSRQRHSLYGIPSGLFTSAPLRVELLQNGKQVLTQQATPRWIQANDRFVVWIGASQTALAPLAGRQVGRRAANAPTIHVAYVKPAEAPARAFGYDAVDVLVLGDTAAESLDAPRRDAIRKWVETGGTLAINGGPDAASLRGDFPDGRRGAGETQYLPFDATRPTTRDDRSVIVIWDDLVNSAITRSGFFNALDRSQRATYGGGNSSYRFGDEGALASACAELSQLDPPSSGLVLGYLCAYLLCLVPINYAVLSRRDRREWAWVTTPAIVAVFCLIAFLLGLSVKGRHVLLARTGLIEAWSGATVGDSRSWIGIFSPSRSRYDVAIEEPEALFLAAVEDGASSAPRFVQGDVVRAEGTSVPMWSMRVLRADLVQPLGRGVRVEWKGQGSPRDAVVTNETPYDIEECRLMHGDEGVSLGHLKRGESRTLPKVAMGRATFRLPTVVKPPNAPTSPEERMRIAVIRAVGGVPYNADGPILVGWITRSPFRVTVNGGQFREENSHFLMVHLQ